MPLMPAQEGDCIQLFAETGGVLTAALHQSLPQGVAPVSGCWQQWAADSKESCWAA